MSLLKGASHVEWMKLSAAPEEPLMQVEHYSDLTAMRVSFQKASNAMIDLSTSFDAQNETLYMQFCPMTNDNKGAYRLSAQKEIFNPNFGE